MGKKIMVERKEDDSYKLILKIELDEEHEHMLKKGYIALALFQNLSKKQTEIIEKLFGYYWYKNCKIKIVK